MKKIIIRIVIVLVVLVVVGVIAVGFFLGDIIKAGMNTVGPKITQTTFVVNSISVSMLTGSAGVKGLVIGNPEGFKSPSAISVGKAAVSVAPFSVLSDKIVVKSVEVRDAEITFEGNPLGANNLKKLMDNVNAIAGAPSAPAANTSAKTGEKKPAKKLEVDDFLITGVKVQFNGTTLPLPPIRLSNL
ncbi:MAG: AsmA family protein, partial [Verrucomicrobiota bacterium]